MSSKGTGSAPTLQYSVKAEKTLGATKWHSLKTQNAYELEEQVMEAVSTKWNFAGWKVECLTVRTEQI